MLANIISGNVLGTSVACLSLLLSSSASAQSLTAQDRKFMEDAAKGNRQEVQLGQIAAQKGSSPAVKRFGQRMVTDHSKANRELEALASKKGVKLPQDTALPADDASLTTKSGAAFDSAYAHEMVSDHEKDIKEFEKEVSSGSDPDVKKWASDTLPTLRSHLEQAKEMNTQNK